jgi:hypothetical protein
MQKILFIYYSLVNHKHLHKLQVILYLNNGMTHLKMRRMFLTSMKMVLIMKEKVCHP